MAVEGLERYRHADPAFEIAVPAGFELGAMPGTLVVARAPEGASASPFRANLTVIAQELPPGTDAATLSEASLAEQARSFPGWRLIDRAGTRIGGVPAERTLITYLLRRDSGVDLGREASIAVEQWRMLRSDVAWIVSGSSETPEYGRVADLWSTCAGTLRPLGRMSAVEFAARERGGQRAGRRRRVDRCPETETRPTPRRSPPAGCWKAARCTRGCRRSATRSPGPRIQLLLERGDRRGQGWLGPDGAVIAHPLPDGRVRLVMARRRRC